MKNWYIVQSYSSFEKKVAEAIKKEAIKAKLEDRIDEVLVPTHEVTEVEEVNESKGIKNIFLDMFWLKWIWIISYII